jgi:hypothetical protein
VTTLQAYEKNGKKLTTRNTKLVQQYTVTIYKAERQKIRFPKGQAMLQGTTSREVK